MNENKLSLDTESQVFFYEQDHYYLSNFSAFAVSYDFVLWPTAEHAYQAQKFAVGPSHNRVRIRIIENMRSAHEAFKYAEAHKEHRRHDWDDVKVAVMRDILRAKVNQHEYVLRKLLETGDRELIENSWRDAFWGWGPHRDGQNMLGKLWMEVRAELRVARARGQS